MKINDFLSPNVDSINSDFFELKSVIIDALNATTPINEVEIEIFVKYTEEIDNIIEIIAEIINE